MRARELRLRRAFRSIAATLLAGPLAAGAACSAASKSRAPDDAGADAAAVDAGLREDGRAPLDATTTRPDASGPSDASSSPPRDSSLFDAEGCRELEETIDAAYFDDNPDGCSLYRSLPCGLPPDPSSTVPSLSGCYIYLGICSEVCNEATTYCKLATVSCTDAGGPIADAAVIVDCVQQCGISGRPPRGLRAPARPEAAATTLGAHFATMAYLESASVRAFRDLEQSLRAHAAPARLLRAARRSAADERRHARAAQRLARRFGGTPSRPRVARVAAPSLVELLADDAVSGCVDETFAALLATWQARHATDARVRRTMTTIAADETRHAALAWEVLDWGLPRLTATERATVARAMDGAMARLRSRDASRETTTEDARLLIGLPTRAAERSLLRELASLVRREASFTT